MSEWLMGMEMEAEVAGVDSAPVTVLERQELAAKESKLDDKFLDQMWQQASIWCEEKVQHKILLMDSEYDRLVDHLDKVLARAERAHQRAKGPVDIQALNDNLYDKRHPSAQGRIDTPPVADSQCRCDPVNAARVSEVLSKTKIGLDLSLKLCNSFQNLVREFADVFVLSLLEVSPVDFIHQQNSQFCLWYQPSHSSTTAPAMYHSHLAQVPQPLSEYYNVTVMTT
ncbi:Retrovirus-related Pol polyprotein from transposon [Ceratobasidium sp. AG-Ba]|nr:Retrovirus-related Pol polyprotein from transposon [Ceratobasidium sp. AG-Ba]